MKTYLYCHTDLIMLPDNYIECEKGKIYGIKDEDRNTIFKETEDDVDHTFSKSDWHPDYYKKWFDIKNEAEIRELKLNELLYEN